MVERNGRAPAPDAEKMQFDLETELQRAKGIDLLNHDPATLPLKEKIRQRRQLEAQAQRSQPQPELTLAEQIRDRVDVVIQTGQLELVAYPPLDETEAFYQWVRQEIDQKLRTTVHPHITAILTQAIENRTDNEIAEELGIRYSTTHSELSRGRKALEQQILHPHGIYRLRDFGNRNALRTAVYDQRLAGIKIAHLFYTSVNNYAHYEAASIKPDPALINEGYAPLAEVVDHATYIRITHNQAFEHYLKRSKGRIHVKLSDIHIIQTALQGPGDSYRQIATMTGNKVQYNRWRKAIQSGKLPGVIEHGRYYATEEDITVFEAARTPSA